MQTHFFKKSSRLFLLGRFFSSSSLEPKFFCSRLHQTQPVGLLSLSHFKPGFDKLLPPFTPCWQVLVPRKRYGQWEVWQGDWKVFSPSFNQCSVPKWPVYGRARPSRRAFVENSPSKARIFVILPVYMWFWARSEGIHHWEPAWELLLTFRWSFERLNISIHLILWCPPWPA